MTHLFDTIRLNICSNEHMTLMKGFLRSKMLLGCAREWKGWEPLLYTLGLCHYSLSHTNRNICACDLKGIVVERIQRISVLCLPALGAGSHYVCYHLALLLPIMLYCSVVTNTPRTIARDDTGWRWRGGWVHVVPQSEGMAQQARQCPLDAGSFLMLRTRSGLGF